MDDVEGGAFGGEDALGGAGDAGEGFARGDPGAVGAVDGDFDAGFVAAEDHGHDVDAGDDHGFAGVDVEGGVGGRVDHEVGGEVAVAYVFQEPEVDEPFDVEAVVHG